MNELAAALINARVAEALIKLEAMRTDNFRRLLVGKPPEHSKKEFLALIEDCEIDYNSVWTTIHEHGG